MPQVGSVELTISNGGWSGDFVQAPNGDLLLSVDSLDASPATIERLTRIVQTTPREFDQYGSPIARGDHPFFQDLGAGVATFVGENYSEELTAEIETRILAATSHSNGIVQDPAPVITFDFSDPLLSISISVETTTGQTATTPAIPLLLGGG